MTREIYEFEQQGGTTEAMLAVECIPSGIRPQDIDAGGLTSLGKLVRYVKSKSESFRSRPT